MKRTTTDNTGFSLSNFVLNNRRLLLFLALFLFGIFGGVMIFVTCHDVVADELALMLKVDSVGHSFFAVVSSLFSSCFFSLLMLAILFLAGLSACGAPMPWLVPLFFGLGVGMTEAYCYAMGGNGVLFTVLFILPHNMISVAALLIGCSESLRMTMLISRQLLPSVHCGGLWQDFKLYYTRFLISAVIALLSGVTDVLMRTFFLRFFI